MFFKKLKIRRMERQWKKYGREATFTWVHRYLRLHGELLEDPVYQDMFDYHRVALIAYLRRDLKNKNLNDEQVGEMLDSLADIFNKFFAERVNAYKPLVDELYKTWENTPDRINIP